jgi:hypothetical protein
MKIRVLYPILLMGALLLAARAAASATLQVGAAKVDITPAADAALPMSGYADRVEGFKGIHDHIYARAIVAWKLMNDIALAGVSGEVLIMINEHLKKQSSSVRDDYGHARQWLERVYSRRCRVPAD